MRLYSLVPGSCGGGEESLVRSPKYMYSGNSKTSEYYQYAAINSVSDSSLASVVECAMSAHAHSYTASISILEQRS